MGTWLGGGAFMHGARDEVRDPLVAIRVARDERAKRLRLHAGLLAHFSSRGFFQRFASLDVTFGQHPRAAVRALDDQHAKVVTLAAQHDRTGVRETLSSGIRRHHGTTRPRVIVPT
jgi:hypothetical protein